MLIVQTTVATRKQAEKIATALIAEKLAACATFFPATSVYFWEGKLHREKEFVIELKIRDAVYAKVERRLRSLHPYSLPQIIATKAARSSNDYGKWVEG